jgi:dolichol-phosphate mannosyltransferase
VTLVQKREVHDKASFETFRRNEAELAERETAGPRHVQRKGRNVPGPADPVDISFVVSVQDAEATLIEQYQRIADALPIAAKFEVVFIDNGSRDRSWEVIGIIARCEPATVRGLRLQRKAGEETALWAGFRAARGRILFTFGADLQDGPREIRRFLDKLGEGYDIVSSSIKHGHDPSVKLFPVRIFSQLLRGIPGMLRHDRRCGLQCLRSEVARKLTLFGEPHAMVRDLATIEGFHATELDVDLRPRLRVRKDRFKHSLHGFIDRFTVGFLKKRRELSAHLPGATSTYHCAAAATLLVAAVILGPFPHRPQSWSPSSPALCS